MSCDIVPQMGKFGRMYKHPGHRVILDKRGSILVRPTPLELHLRPGTLTPVLCISSAGLAFLQAALKVREPCTSTERACMVLQPDLSCCMRHAVHLLKQAVHAEANLQAISHVLQASTGSKSTSWGHIVALWQQ